MDRILLIDDDSNAEELTRMAFSKAGITTELDAVNNGSDALAYLCKHLPSCILLDLKLPGMHGFDILKEIRQNPNTQFIPVVVLTASDCDGDVKKSYQLGANAYVCRPSNFNTLIETIKRTEIFWSLINKTVKQESANA
jgi:CheY-like chemotaxis protein